MKKIKVYFCPVNKSTHDVSSLARKLFEKVVEENHIVLQKEIPIKVHTGQPGNITFIKPENFKGFADALLEKNIKTYFIETGMENGPRSKASTHIQVAQKHGFNQIPFVVTDGEIGNDHVMIPIRNGKYFKACKIARKLAEQNQIIVASHFKGHILSGFAGAIKMLGIGFASRSGKMEVHSKIPLADNDTIDWSNWNNLYHQKEFIERTCEYAFAAINNKKYIYLNFAMNITKDCDCDGHFMKPIYNNLGIFASTDPVAIDKACFDLLAKREGKTPFSGEEIFDYAEKIVLGSKKYELIEL